MTPSIQRDPRSIITPDAFEVSSALVGTPLARPRRRAAALLVDGIVIGIITAITKSFALILGVVAAVLFIRAGFQRTKVRGSVFGRAMRFSVGCLGVFIAIVTAVLWTSFGVDFSRRGPSGVESALESLVTIEGEAYAEDPDSPVDATPPTPGSERAEIASYTDREALTAYAELLVADSADASYPLRRSLLESRLVALVGADSLAVLELRIADLEDEVEDGERALGRTRAALDDATSGGFFASLRNIADELGFGFGWAALYMTVFLSWWNGQTIGKRLLGIRVVRLDGGPITWWIAFERAGGYAAGLATGLLGFAQVWWDANRQAIHDRIVGTVVVEDGAEKIIDWEAAL